MTVVEESPRRATTGRPPKMAALLDGDIHPSVLGNRLAERLDEPWKSHYLRYGGRAPNPPMFYPRVRNGGQRLDARPAGGGPTGSSLPLMQEQLLDMYGLEYGVLIPLQSHSFGAEKREYSIALSRALNECIKEDWLDQEPRLRSSIAIPHESPDAAAAEIEHWADDPRFVQVLLPTISSLPLGLERYWPLYEAAANAGLPVGVHFGGMENHRGAGWPSFYLEEHVWAGNSMAAYAMNLICEGVFERFPSLQVVLVEGGMAWSPALMWAMDEAFSQLRDEVGHLRRRPSEYFREHFWFTTQPIEEPEDSQHLADMVELGGMGDRMIFASDYPHWDFDSPTMALRHLPKDLRAKILFDNANRLYGLADGDAR